MAPSETGYRGTLDATKGFGDYNSMAFIIRQILASSHVATLVQVKAVTNAGEVSPVGSVDVQPMVNMLDGQGASVPHGTIYSIPYFRIQGGSNAVILDPQVNDIGIAVFAESDISGVKAAKGQANPGSSRKFDMADGLYLGGFLNGVPTQYVQFTASGISIVTPNNIDLQAGGNIAMTSAGLTHNGVNVGSTHTHPVTNVQPGTSTIESGTPQ